MSAWAWPQWLVLGFLVFRIVVGMGIHGNERRGQYNAGEIAGFTVLYAWVLWMGGFWQ